MLDNFKPFILKDKKLILWENFCIIFKLVTIFLLFPRHWAFQNKIEKKLRPKIRLKNVAINFFFVIQNINNLFKLLKLI